MLAMKFGLRDWAGREPHRIAVKDASGKSTSFRELDVLANKFAQLFRQMGLSRGDHVEPFLAMARTSSPLYGRPIALGFTLRRWPIRSLRLN